MGVGSIRAQETVINFRVLEPMISGILLVFGGPGSLNLGSLCLGGLWGPYSCWPSGCRQVFFMDFRAQSTRVFGVKVPSQNPPRLDSQKWRYTDAKYAHAPRTFGYLAFSHLARLPACL